MARTEDHTACMLLQAAVAGTGRADGLRGAAQVAHAVQGAVTCVTPALVAKNFPYSATGPRTCYL